MSTKMSGKPRGRTTAFRFFAKDCKEALKGQYSSSPEASKMFKERWKSLSDNDRLPYKLKADADKVRYQRELQQFDQFAPNPSDVGKGRKRKRDPNAPKRNLSAYFFFCGDKRRDVKLTNPTFGIGDVAKVLGKLWKETSEEQKAKYKAQAQQDKIRYDAEKAEYEKRVTNEEYYDDEEEEESE